MLENLLGPTAHNLKIWWASLNENIVSFLSRLKWLDYQLWISTGDLSLPTYWKEAGKQTKDEGQKHEVFD